MGRMPVSVCARLARRVFTLGLIALLAGAGPAAQPELDDTGTTADELRIGQRGTGQRGTGGLRGRGVVPLRGGRSTPARGRGPASATSGRIEQRTYLLGDTNETMEYYVFVSKKVDPSKPSPLVIGLHGLGTPPDRWLSRITDAVDRAGFIAVAPMGYSLTGGYGATGPGRPIGDTSVGALGEKDVLNVLELARQEFNVDEQRIYLAGHSMGGAGALYLGIKHRRIWAAVAASAPAVRTDLHTPADLEQATALPIFFAHGDADNAVPVRISRDWAAKAKALLMTYEYLEIRGAGHDSLGQSIDAIFKFFGKHVRPAAARAAPARPARGYPPLACPCASPFE